MNTTLECAGTVKGEGQVSKEVTRQSELVAESHGIVDDLAAKLIDVLSEPHPTGGGPEKDKVQEYVGMATRIRSNNDVLAAQIAVLRSILERLEL